ncbi:MAG: glutamyl-tRNA reductase [Myxococcota bacterium]|nr:glutamyl-tRNA reductase [Myxococcota bacterium]
MIRQGEIVAVGLNHHTAPVEFRERLAMDSLQLPVHLSALLDQGLAEESVILSTCNRVEVYALVRDSDPGRGIVSYMAGLQGVNDKKSRSHFFCHEGEAAVAHLFRVASSLDSLVLGEPQILGQLKGAYFAAQEAQAVGLVLRRLMRQAISVGKRVRTVTRIGQEPVSVGTAGVALARQVFGNLDGRTALVVGAGEISELVSKALIGAGVEELVVANRTFENAQALAARVGGIAVPYEQLSRYLAQVDVAIASTASQRPILTRKELQPVIRARRYKPLFLLDLSVPRNIAADVNDLEGAFVFNIDDLGEVASRGRQRREAEAVEAENLVVCEAERTYRGLGQLSAAPVISSMTQRAEAVRQMEMDRSRMVLETLDSEQRAAVEAMTRSMFKRFLHDPILHARNLAESGDGQSLDLLGDAFPEAPEE